MTSKIKSCMELCKDFLDPETNRYSLLTSIVVKFLNDMEFTTIRVSPTGIVSATFNGVRYVDISLKLSGEKQKIMMKELDVKGVSMLYYQSIRI